MEECPFNNFLIKFTLAFHTYSELIVLESIMRSKANNCNIKPFMLLHEICSSTNLHSRDVMKYVINLQKSKIIDIKTVAVDCKRHQVFGINYYDSMNNILSRLKVLKQIISQNINDEMFCIDCNKMFLMVDCISNCEMSCPVESSHRLTENIEYSCEEIECTNDLIQCAQNLTNSHPVYRYSLKLNTT